MRILFVGDVVGRSGVNIVINNIEGIRRQESVDLVIVNAENADGGTGLTPSIYRKLIAAGVDCITLGDHIYKKKDIIDVLESESNIIKPGNYPPDSPGKPWTVVKAANGRQVAVLSLIGRVFMKPVDCPFQAADRILDEIPDTIKIRFCDFHAEATSDKQLMGRYLDGRVTACIGTHTHVPTADGQVLPGGTAFQCDAGMTGPHESILGRDIEKVLTATMTFRPVPFSVAKEDIRLNGVLIDVEPKSGRAHKLQRFCLTEKEAERYETDD